MIEITKGDPNLSTPSNGYLKYLAEFRKSPLAVADQPISSVTFHRHYRNHSSGGDLNLKRGGRRASNAAAASIDPRLRTLLPTRAFSIAHVDHYLVDIGLLLGHAKRKPLTRRPWLTAMVDGYSGEVLGLWLSYKAPCRNSCAMVVRDCVSRHGRLPETLVVDGGKEFHSIHFTALLASLAVTRFERPPEDPRFGKEVERLFGSFKESFARGLPGFVPGVAYARKMSGKLSSANRAGIEFSKLVEMLESYVFDGYNLAPKPGTISSRNEMRAKSDAAFPFNGRRVALDTAFLIQTAVDAPRDSYQVAHGRGIRVYGTWYGCPALFEYRGAKKAVQVRIEPFDSSIAYICLGDTWLVCRSTAASINDALPTLEVIARAAQHQQLRALTAALAREAELATYETKKSALGLLQPKGPRTITPMANKAEIPTSKPKHGPMVIEVIEDLLMDEEGA
jgi:putative transposase